MNKLRPIGRMIRRDLSGDEGIARLSDGAFRLYIHMLIWLDSHGKFTGGPGTIAETIIPLHGWSRKKILSYLAEINSHTSMRVWTQFGRFYVQDVRFFEKQDIREDRRGRDTLPSYPGANRMKTDNSPFSIPEYVPEQVPPEVEVEVEADVKNKGEVEVQVRPRGGNGEGGFEATPPTAPVATPTKHKDGNGAGNELPEDVTSYLKRLPEANRETVLAQVQDYWSGAITRDEGIDTVMRLRIPRPDAEALFPEKVPI